MDKMNEDVIGDLADKRILLLEDY